MSVAVAKPGVVAASCVVVPFMLIVVHFAPAADVCAPVYLSGD